MLMGNFVDKTSQFETGLEFDTVDLQPLVAIVPSINGSVSEARNHWEPGSVLFWLGSFEPCVVAFKLVQLGPTLEVETDHLKRSLGRRATSVGEN